MNCEQAEKWHYLYRPGELSPEENAALKRHVAVCPRCTALSERIAAAERTVARLRVPLPESPDAESAAGEVLRVITAAKSRPGRPIAAILNDFLPLLPDRARIRYAAAALVGLLGGILIFQQISVMRDVASLEERMAAPRDLGEGLRTAFLLDSETVSSLPGSQEILGAIADRVVRDRNQDILITRDDALSLRETLARAALYDARIRAIVGKNRTVIDETVRALRLKPNTVFRVFKKGGA